MISTLWKNEGLVCRSMYKRKFAFWPIRIGNIVFFKFYYKKYHRWGFSALENSDFHEEFVENITAEEYVMRKLAEKL